MKKILCTILFAWCFLIMTGCSQNEAGEKWDRRPMVMVENKIYMDTGKQVAAEIDDSEILGTITSSVDSSEKPTQNGESNFDCKGAKYAYHDDGLVVMLQNKWVFFERESETTGTEPVALGTKIDIENVSFKMEIQDIFEIKDVGIILTGQIATGSINVTSNIVVTTSDGIVQYKGTVDSIEMINNNNPKSASAGDNVGLLFSDESIKYHVDKGLFVVRE